MTLRITWEPSDPSKGHGAEVSVIESSEGVNLKLSSYRGEDQSLDIRLTPPMAMVLAHDLIVTARSIEAGT